MFMVCSNSWLIIAELVIHIFMMFNRYVGSFDVSKVDISKRFFNVFEDFLVNTKPILIVVASLESWIS